MESINNTNQEWVYLGLFLDKQSRYNLIRNVGKYIPDGWKVYAHHMTLVYNKHDEISQEYHDLYKNAMGKEFTVVVTEIGKSNDALAVKVTSHLKMTNKIQHITIAVPMDGKPVNSNYITQWVPIEKPFSVSGTIQDYLRK